jgi:hypothetical protein
MTATINNPLEEDLVFHCKVCGAYEIVEHDQTPEHEHVMTFLKVLW